MTEEGTLCKAAKATYDAAPKEPVDVKAGLKTAMDKACKSGADQEKI